MILLHVRFVFDGFVISDHLTKTIVDFRERIISMSGCTCPQQVFVRILSANTLGKNAHELTLRIDGPLGEIGLTGNLFVQAVNTAVDHATLRV